MSASTKNLLKSYCRYVYYAGAGNFWYENIYPETGCYKVYSAISFSIYFVMIFLENLAFLFGEFPEVEKKSSMMFAAIHDIILIKMFLLLYHKSSIRQLNYEMATVMESIEEGRFMKKQQTKVKWGIIFYVITVYLSLSAYGVESLRKSIVEGAPFYTVVTYFPHYQDDSNIASILRVFFYMTWLYMMLPMISADCMPIIHLITIAYKFITLCQHFERIKRDFDKNVLVMRNEEATKILKAGCLEGIRIHQKLMLYVFFFVFYEYVYHKAKNENLTIPFTNITKDARFIYEFDSIHIYEIHRVFGITMSLQVCESSAVAVLLLLRLALSPHLNLTNAFMTYTFVGSLFFLLALNLWNAGEITYQASLLANSMFYCGWHLCKMNHQPHKDIRHLILIGCTQAQKPLILKAFGIQDLSYNTFVSVARMTYSIFAVFYQRRE